MSRGWLLGAARQIAVRPWLWPTAVTQLARLAPRGWWREEPRLPLPRGDYLTFRLQTQYGAVDRDPDPRDVVSYLEWCRRYGRLTG